MTSNDYDYQNEDIYESNERFYFELKTTSSSPSPSLSSSSSSVDIEDRLIASPDSARPYKVEYDLVQCVYVQLNLTLSNASLAKQLRQYTHGKAYMNLSRFQVKSLFSLNKHNGVLSSRKVINSMLPGVYLFTIALKVVNRTNHSVAVEADRTHFKLIVLPPSNTIASNFTTGNFYKFDREFYKFKINNLGNIKLVNRIKYFNTSQQHQHRIKFKLIENKFNSKQRLITLDEKTGQLKLNSNSSSIDFDDNSDDTEIVLYALATVDLHRRNSTSILSRLEYMCEIYIETASPFMLSSSSSTTRNPMSSMSSGSDEIRIVPSTLRLKLEETLPRDLAVAKLIALLDIVDERRSFVKFDLVSDETGKFEVDSKLGSIRLVRELSANEARISLNVSACIEAQCAFAKVDVDVVDVNNNAPKYVLKVNTRCKNMENVSL